MKRTTLATIAVLVLLAIVGVVYAVFKPGINSVGEPTTQKTDGNSNSTSTNPATNQTPAASPSSGSDQTSVGATIYIKDKMFTPPQINIQKGSSVSWSNNDDTAHTITIDHGDGPSSGTIPPGGTYSYTFNTVGSFQYHCEIHPSMRGTIVVQ